MLYLRGKTLPSLETNNQINLPDLSASLLKNLVLKTKILLGLFLIIFAGQIIIISTLVTTNCDAIQNVPKKMMVFGPLFLFSAAGLEFLYLRYLNKLTKNNKTQDPVFTYLIAFTEISFPALVMFIIISMAGNKMMVPVNEILNSPPFILYFILVVLSSLHLNKKLCAFTGLIAGIQYTCVCIYFKNRYNIEALFIPNIIAKSVLIFVCGLAAGFVSDKIKQALIEALHAQDKLINQLDRMVKEKTNEISKQKTEIEEQHEELKEKQKEIVDSIHYAKRIQNSLMPTEKYIDKNLKQLNK